MSEFRQAIEGIVSDREVGTAEQCVNLATGQPFTAEIEKIEDLEIPSEISRDYRPQVYLYVSNRQAASAIDINKQVLVILNGLPVKFLILERDDNPAEPQVKFTARRVIAKDK